MKEEWRYSLKACKRWREGHTSVWQPIWKTLSSSAAICVPSMVKYIWLDESTEGTRVIVGSRKTPEKNALILAGVTHFYILELRYACPHTDTHAETHQWRRKQKHLEKSSSGRHGHDLRGLAVFPITWPVQLSARWLPSAFAVATDGCTTNWWNP